MNKFAVVTISLYEVYDQIIQYTKPYLELYCNKYGFDLCIIDTIKINVKSANLEKFQLYDLLDIYDRILYVDADIIIHPNAPNVFDIVPDNLIGAVYDNPSNNKLHPTESSLNEIQIFQSALGEIQSWTTEYINSGVMVVSKCHRNVFTNAESRTTIDAMYQDQTLINWNIQNYGFQIYRLDSKFNAMGITGFPNDLFKYGANQLPAIDAHFIHFAAAGEREKTIRYASQLLIDKYNLNIPYPENLDLDLPLAFIDIGEIGWSQYLSGYINYLKTTKNQKSIIICHPYKNVLYRNIADDILPIPECWNLEYSKYETEGSHLFDTENRIRVMDMFNITKLIRDTYPKLNYSLDYGKFINERIIIPYSHNQIYLNELNIVDNCILVFPRCRPSKFSERNIDKRFWISMINTLCDIYPKLKIISIGSLRGSFNLSNDITYDNFIDLVPYDDLKTLDIMVGLCNTKQAICSFGNVTGPIKMALVCGTPSFVFGHDHELKRITQEENYCNTDCGYYSCQLPNGNDPYVTSFTINESDLMNQVISFFNKYI